MSHCLRKHLVIVVGLLASCGSVAAQLRPLSPDDILNTRWAASVALSPDGRDVAYLVLEPSNMADPRSRRTSSLWIAPCNRSRAPQKVAMGHYDVGSPAWNPDGSLLAFLSQGNAGGEGRQVWVCDTRTKATRCVTALENGVVNFSWSPTGKEFAVTSRQPSKSSNDPIQVDSHHGWNQLFVVNSANATVSAVTRKEQHIVDFTWSPDEESFAAVVAPSGDVDTVFESARLVLLNRNGTISKTLNERVSDRMGVAWSPDGRKIAFMEFAPKHFAWRLAISNIATGDISYPLHDYDGTPEAGFGSLRWAKDSKHLWLRTFESTRCRLVRVNVDENSFKRMENTLQNFWSHSISNDERTFAFAADTPHAPPNVSIKNVDGNAIQLTDLNPQLSAFGLGNTREVRWKNTVDGKTVFGVVITPPDFQPKIPRPTVVQLHGGPQEMWWNSWLGTQLAWGQLLASNGYVVFLPNPRGSIGQGWKFNEGVHREWGGMDVQDVMDGIDVLVKEGVIDEDRIGIGGWSYGGFLAAAATTKSTRFKAAIVGAPITDLYSYALTVDEVAWVRRMLGGNEVSDRKRIVELSPLTHISRCKTPTLLLHGEEDLRCPLAQGRAWYRGLKSLGVASEMIVYPREGHIFGERGHEEDLQSRVLGWYQKYL